MEFRDRALHEARRYGGDPFVFVRELVQNARDADARAAHFDVTSAAGHSRVACRDDGTGMSLEHARRFLFTLYASSKEGRRDAGRFGVGFWSVLRFEPSRIVVRSWPRRGAAWEIALSGDLDRAMLGEPPPCPFASGHGTEVVLERAAEDPALLRRVKDAAWQGARFVSRRDDPLTPLDLRVNGQRATAPFELPRPSATFRRGPHRGVVALGRASRVELFARGLRVRSAAALHDLASCATSASRVRFPETEGLVPQALLDGDDLEPLLARSDVRDDRALRRLLRLAEDALGHLVERQLALARPEPRWRRAKGALAIAAALAAGVSLGRLGWPPRPAAGAARPAAAVRSETALDLSEVAALPPRPPEPFRDLSDRYTGPRASAALGGLGIPLLRYTPAESRPYLAALLLDDVSLPPLVARQVGPYVGAACGASCLELTMLLEGGPGVVRLPRASGHVIDPASLRVGGRATPLGRGALGEPVLVLERAERCMVSYRSGPGSEFGSALRTSLAPAELRAAAREIGARPLEARVLEAAQWVRARVRYSVAEVDVASHRTAEAAGEDVLERALRIGAGDCDVQNAVLAALLQEAGVYARLAVGYVGESGGALPMLHAWVEWADGTGRFHVADASENVLRQAGPPPPVAVAATFADEAGSPSRLGFAPAVAVIGALTALGLVAARRPRRRVALDPAHDVTRLLRGALTQPAAFRHAPAVFERRLVPLHPRGAARLGDVWDAATRRRLFRTERGAPLAERVARCGGLVVDALRPEGRVVADALGAVELDSWDGLLGRSRGSRLLGCVEKAFSAAGELVSIRRADELGAPLVLDRPAGRLGRGVHRTLVLDSGEPWLSAAERLAGGAPAEAAFIVADRVAHLLRLEPRRSARVLAPLAEAALRERG